MEKFFSNRVYSDENLCRFLDILEEAGTRAHHVVAISDDVYLVVYKWNKHISYISK